MFAHFAEMTCKLKVVVNSSYLPCLRKCPHFFTNRTTRPVIIFSEQKYTIHNTSVQPADRQKYNILFVLHNTKCANVKVYK